MVATRATRQDKPRSAAPSSAQDTVDLTDAITGQSVQDNAIDIDIEDLVNAAPPIAKAPAPSTQRSGGRFASGHVPLPQAQRSRTATSSRMFSPIPRVSSHMRQARSDPPRRSVLPEDPSNIQEVPRSTSVSEVSEGPQACSAEDSSGNLEKVLEDARDEWASMRPSQYSDDILPRSPKNNSTHSSEGLPGTVENVLEDARDDRASKRPPHFCDDFLPRSPKNTLDQSDMVLVEEDRICEEPHLSIHHAELIEEPATGDGQTAVADLSGGLRTPSTSSQASFPQQQRGDSTICKHPGRLVGEVSSGEGLVDRQSPVNITLHAFVGVGTSETPFVETAKDSSSPSQDKPDTPPPSQEQHAPADAELPQRSTQNGATDSAPSPTPPLSFAAAVKNAKTANGKAKVPMVLTRPSREQLLKLLQMADDDTCTDEAMFEAMQEAIPYPQKQAVTHFWVTTGSALSQHSNDKIISSIFSENDSAPWAALLSDFVQVNKARGGDLVIHVASEDAKIAMFGQTITILGNPYPVSEPRQEGQRGQRGSSLSIHDHYFVDIIGVRANFDSKKLMRLLRRSKTSPILQGYKSTVQGGACHGNIWRVYFRQNELPSPLKINGHPIDQLKLDGVYYAVFAKDYVKSTVPRENNRSAHCLDLDWLENPAQGPPEQPVGGPQPEAKRSKQGKVIDLTEILPGVAQTVPQVQSPKQDDDMGVPPEQPHQGPTAVLPPSTVTSKSATTAFEKPKKTAKRKQDDLAKSWVSDNFFDHLRDLQANTSLVQFSFPNRQVYRVTIGSIPELTSNDLSASIKRTQVKDGRLDWHPDNLSLKEIVDILAQHASHGEERLTHVEQDEQLAASDPMVPIEAWIQEVDIDALWQWASANPLMANFYLADLNNKNLAAFEALVRLHTWHRWISATSAPAAHSFVDGFKQVFGMDPSMSCLADFPKDAAFAETLSLPDGLSFLDIEDALSALEIWLSLQAKELLDRDAWLISITERPVVALPTTSGPRQFSADTLWNVLHSTFGQVLLANLTKALPSRMVSTLEQLRELGYRYSEQRSAMFKNYLIDDKPHCQLQLGLTLHY